MINRYEVSLILLFFLGASFAEALGMCTMPQPSRKRSHNSSNHSRKAVKMEVMSPPSKKKMPAVKIEPDYNDEPSVI